MKLHVTAGACLPQLLCSHVRLVTIRRMFGAALSTALLLTMSQQALAAGFQITEQTITGLGRGFAASGIAGDDVGDLFFNPAGIVLLPGRNVQVGGTFITAGTEFQNRGSNQELITNGFVPVDSTGPGDDGGVDALVPNLYYTMDLNPQLKFGLGITPAFGLATEYDRKWIGRYHAVESELKTVDFIPTLAYRAGQVTVGAGIIAQYADATLSQAVFTAFNPATGVQNPDAFAEITADSWGFGLNLGIMIQATPATRVGVAFRSKITQAIEGERAVSGTPDGLRDGVVGARANIDLPETIYIGFVRELTPQWDLLLGTRWTRWNRLPELRISFAEGADAVTPLGWENSWTLSAGTRYDLNSQLTLRAGYIYDESPVPGPELRTPRVPDSDRHWVSLGASYSPWRQLTIDFGYAHIFFDDARVEIETNLVSTLPGGFTDNLNGFYDSPDADLIGLGVQYRF